MSEFDGKQYYGFSMQNNQNLSTTTKNFEFRYMRPEFLEKAIQKVNSKDDSKMQQRNKMMENFRQIRPATTEIEKQHIKTFKRDQDVETQINTGLIKETEEIRKLSNSEIDNLIEKIKQKNEASSSRIEDREANKSTSNFMRSELRQHDMVSRCIEKNSDQIVDTDQKDQSSICTSITKNKTIHMMDYFEPQISIAQTPEIIDNVMLEEYRRPQPKWVEIEEPRIETRMEIDIKCNDIEINSSKTVQSPHSSRFETNANMKYYQLPIQQFSQINQCMPAVLMTEILSDNGQTADEHVKPTQYNVKTMDHYFVEDSDSEQELINRFQYTKCIQPHPKPNEMLNLSIDEDHDRKADFLEIENNVFEEDEKYLRNLLPLKFTDFEDDAFDKQSQKNSHMKIYINGLTKQIGQNEHPLLASETAKTPVRCSLPQKKPLFSKTSTTPDRCSSPQTEPQPLKSKTKPSLRQQHLQQTFERLAGGTCSRSSTPHERVLRKSAPDSFRSGRSSRSGVKCALVDKETVTDCKSIKSKTTERYSQKSQNLVVSKSIEDLKAEKTNIFNKMTATQEKMIEVLDKLRICLVEINIPENNHEKTRRQKNAFEFSVRFSRNFLYPLKGMQEDLIQTSNEQFNSLNSNESCNRLCCMYGLLLQSLNTYQKQIRYFLLDHVHQKLTTLIEIIQSTTTICLEKKIFSKHDVIVDCLQQRCSKFLSFLAELQEEREQMTRQSYHKLTLDKAHSKYDLKMCMNDLNMYEPKLIPKVMTTNRSAKIKKNKAKRPLTQVIVDDTPDTLVEKPPEDTIPTHIQSVTDNKSSGCAVDSQFNKASGDGISLDKNVCEALQNVTKEQLRQVLDPIIDSMGLDLGNQQNSETIEAILNALNLKQFTNFETEKQPNIDNKYEKEMKSETVELSSVDSLGNTCKSLKAAKQTKTLRQQNSHETLNNKKRSSTTTGIIGGGDDDNSNNKNDSNINANSKRNNNSNRNSSSSKRNSTTHLRNADDVGSGAGAGGGGGGGAHNSEANHMGETTTTHESVLKKINKSKNLMNEDQINENIRHRGEEEDLQSYGNPRNPENISSSDSEAVLNNKHKKHRRRNTSKPHQKSHDSYISLQRSSSNHSQCQISSSSRKSSQPKTSFHCLQTAKTKSRSLKNKRDPTLPPAPSVTPTSSTGHITDNGEDVEETQLDQIPSQNNRDENMLRNFSSMGNVKISLTENTKPLKSGKLAVNRSDYYAETREHRTNVECDSDFKLDADDKSSFGASYIEVYNKSDSPIYANKSQYNSSEDFPPKKSLERKLKYREIGKKITPEPSLSLINKHHQRIKTLDDQPLEETNFKDQTTKNMDRNEKQPTKSNIPIDEMIEERNRFLEMCKNNHFYNNPNYAEPWKIFSSISERLLSDVLSSVEDDFAFGVSRFVNDFLELETKI